MSDNKYRPQPGTSVNLADYDPNDDGGMSKKEARKATEAMLERMMVLQEMLYAQGEKSLLIVLQAMDAGGKDSTIKKVFGGVNPQGVQVNSFKAPSKEELAHDYLWRIHHHTPPKGYVGIFNRSHYEDVLIVRVENLVPPDVWGKRYDHINAFEQMLVDNNTRILKFYLNIDKIEQRERFQERLDRPEKNWKFSIGDMPVREKWDQYMEAYETVLSRCNTEDAPWYIIPANRKWYRNYVITKTIVDTLESMDLSYPPPEEGLDSVVIPD